MANRTPNLESNAIPESQKIVTASNEIIRRYKNTSRSLKPEIIETVLRDYMDELAAGGYPLAFRVKVLEAATTGYIRM